jgi:tetratricopeptide (TPR) repeat protein
MKAYRDAIDVAKSAIDRPADEQDANNLAFAIQQLQVAQKIKGDGPWNPADLLERARTLKAQIEKAHADTSKNMDRDFCAKALGAIEQQHYKLAAQYICLVANDNPGYSCGDDEAVHMCQVNTDLAKMDKGGTPALTPVPKVEQPAGASSSALDRAKAAYDKNDFERARTLFKGVDAGSKPDADQYLEKISHYTDSMASGEKLSRDNQYDQARTAFLAAAAIKPDGPGDPQNRASAMELFTGLDHFYSGDYASAIQHLQNCARIGTQKQPLVHFYLGASELAKYFVTGSEDASLHQDALNDLKQAKQAGFKATGQDLSPKILQVYKELSF